MTRLSDTDPTRIEQLLGATATALESMLYEAPGDPLPRFVFEWTADRGMVLVPDPRSAPADG